MLKKMWFSIVVNCIALVAACESYYMASSAFNGWGKSQLIGWNIWILLPYIFNVIVFFIGVLFFKEMSKAIVKSSIVVSILILIFTLFMYSLVNTGSTGGLLFLAVPLYLLVGGPIIFIIVVLIFRKYQQAKK